MSDHVYLLCLTIQPMKNTFGMKLKTRIQYNGSKWGILFPFHVKA